MTVSPFEFDDPGHLLHQQHCKQTCYKTKFMFVLNVAADHAYCVVNVSFKPPYEHLN